MVTSLITISWWLQIAILLFMITRWTMKLWINNLIIQIPSLNYNNTYTGDSKYWNILLLPFSLFNQNQSFNDNSNSIKPNTCIHMTKIIPKIKTIISKSLYLIQSLFYFTLFIYLFFSDCAFFSFFFLLCFIKLFLINQNLSHIC